MLYTCFSLLINYLQFLFHSYIVTREDIYNLLQFTINSVIKYYICALKSSIAGFHAHECVQESMSWGVCLANSDYILNVKIHYFILRWNEIRSMGKYNKARFVWNKLSEHILAWCSISITPEDVIKIFGFLPLSGGIETEHWAKMGYEAFRSQLI